MFNTIFHQRDQRLSMNKTRIGIVSGYFNPLHKGHIEYINSAKENCDYLICIVNNDDQVKLKGSYPFMDEDHRLMIVKNLKDVDIALIAIDTDTSISETLDSIANDVTNEHYQFVFFNSGDRSPGNENTREIDVCVRNNIQREFIDLPKICSSSELKANFAS